jgi:hypothetical protein
MHLQRAWATGLISAAAVPMTAQLAGAASVGTVPANVIPTATTAPITTDRIASSLCVVHHQHLSWFNTVFLHPQIACHNVLSTLRSGVPAALRPKLQTHAA